MHQGMRPSSHQSVNGDMCSPSLPGTPAEVKDSRRPPAAQGYDARAPVIAARRLCSAACNLCQHYRLCERGREKGAAACCCSKKFQTKFRRSEEDLRPHYLPLQANVNISIPADVSPRGRTVTMKTAPCLTCRPACVCVCVCGGGGSGGGA